MVGWIFFEGGILGETDYVTFVFHVDGSIPGDDVASFSFEFDTEDEYCCSDNAGDVFCGPYSASGNEISLTAEFTYISESNGDDPLFIEALLSGNATVSRGDTGSASLNFGSTVILTEVIAPVGVSITSLSGTEYLAPLVSPVPVPAAIWLFGTALIGLVGFGKRSKAA
jgi:hypothetical protein